ncbi:hypothetical protein DFH11DRAFT_1730738 [Phellopilus nigrolimitatus]|nr:hypothetical protein DFH11DRAFT_1730738 [Phellopilus nigrolimitatus]
MTSINIDPPVSIPADARPPHLRRASQNGPSRPPRQCLLDTPCAYLPERVAGALSTLREQQTQEPSKRNSIPPLTARPAQTASAMRRDDFSDTASSASGVGPPGERALNDVAGNLDAFSACLQRPRLRFPSAASATARVPLPSSERAAPAASGRSNTDEAGAPAAKSTGTGTDAAAPLPGTERAILLLRDAVCSGAGAMKSARAPLPPPKAEPLADEHTPAPYREDRRAESAQSGEGVQRVDSGSGRERRGRAGRRGSRNLRVYW